MSDHNPFADPFADPSVTSASSSKGGAYGDEYNNPFEMNQSNRSLAASSASAAVASPTGGAYAAASPPKKDTPKSALLAKKGGDVEMKPQRTTPQLFPGQLSEDDLRVREQNLLRREEELAERERAVEEQSRRGGNTRADNWPFKCYPLAYHSIVDEIPQAHRTLVRKFYVAVIFAWLCIFWNWLTMLIGWGSSIDDIGGSDALWSSIYLLIGIPGSWKLWYRSLYYAIRDNATGKWVVFFVSFMMHIGFAVVMGLGVPDCAAAGFFVMTKLFVHKQSLLGIFALVNLCLWGLSALTSFYLLKTAHSLWKKGGGERNLKKAVATAAVQEAVNQKMAEQQQHNGGGNSAEEEL